MPGTRPKLMHMAYKFIDREEIHPASREANEDNKNLPTSQQIGWSMLEMLRTAWRRTGGHGSSRAAHYKRLATKAKNIRARSSKRK